MHPSPVQPSSPLPTTGTLIGEAISRSGQLTSLPEVAMEIMRLADDPQSTGDDIDRVLSTDPILSARVLKVVNSAFYGMRREVTSIGTAVVVLGFGAIKSVAVAASLTRMFRASKMAGGFEPRDLWTHSIATAVAARLVAVRARGVEPSDAFLAGLIHDIGVIVELHACAPEFAAVVAATHDDPTLSFRETEARMIGADHEGFGEALCRTWRFPVELQRVAGYHHRPLELPDEARRMTAIVHVADVLAARAALGYTRTVESTTIDPEVLAWLSVSEIDLQELQAVLAAAVEEILPVMSGGA